MSSDSAVIKYGFQDHKEYFDSKANNKKHLVTCKFCRKKITERLGTTSAFTRHLKLVHPANYKEYFESTSRSAGNENQRNIHSFFTSATQSPESSSSKYGAQHPRRKLINESIVKHLIVGCSLPLSIVENSHFRQFMHTLEPKYPPVARSTVTSALMPQIYEDAFNRLKTILQM